MSEISFQYKVNTEPLHEARFSYWLSESTEYGLVYQRYIALSDASTFNSPVAITKVAAGLYQLYGLFVDVEPYDFEYQNLLISFTSVHDIERHEILTPMHRESKEFSIYPDVYNMALPSYVLNIYTEYYLGKDDIILNRYENPSVSTADEFLSSHIKEHWLKQDYVISKYSHWFLDEYDTNHLSRYQELRNLTFVNHLNIMDTTGMLSTFDKELSIYETLLASPFDNELSRIELITTSLPDRRLTRIENLFLALPDMNTYVFPAYVGQRPDMAIHTNIIPQISLQYPYLLHANIIEQLHGKRALAIGNVHKTLINTPNEKHANVQDTIFGTPSNKYIHMLSSLVFGKAYLKHVNDNQFLQAYRHYQVANGLQDIFVHKDILYADAKQNISPIFKDIDIASCLVSYTAYQNNNSISEFTYVHGTLDQKFTGLHVDVWTIANMQNAKLFDGYTSGKKFSSDIVLHDDVFMSNNFKHVMINSIVSGIVYSNDFSIDAYQLFTLKDKQGMRASQSILAGTMSQNSIWLDDTMFSLYKDIYGINIWYQSFIFKDNHSLSVPENEIFIYKDSQSVTEWQNFAPVSKITQELFIHNADISGFKSNRSASLHDTVSAFKNSLDVTLSNQMRTLVKTMHSVYVATENWILKGQHDASVKDQWFAYKTMHDGNVFRPGYSATKTFIPVYIPDIDFIFKNELPTSYMRIIRNGNFGNIIIPLSKVKHRAYIDNINTMVQKLAGKGYLNQAVSASVIPHDVRIPDLDIFCDKQAFNAFIDYKNNQITKSKIHGFISKDVLVRKESRLTHLEASFLVDKKISKGWLDKPLNVRKKSYNGHIDGDLSAMLIVKDIYCNNSIFVDKISQMCYYDYNMTTGDKTQFGSVYDDGLNATKRPQKTHVLDCISPAIRHDLKGFFDFGVFTDKTFRDSALFQQLDEVHTLAYDTGIRPDDFGNWVWVYETPDPFTGVTYGIDELLLPENDTRYENFEDIIFNKNTMRPRNPVKIIDDHTFIAKYPIKHPLTSKHADIAVNYDDGAVKLEQFYGIETSVMHTVFLKFYRIWQSKIFEFGTMTMMQSVKLMMEYLYAWIMEYFPLEELEQALRVFKLIRWYGETSIIQNSQYIISYEYDTLESKLTTGQCLIPNDLDSNDTMYVDAKLGVIRNDPTKIGSDAYVTFTIQNKKNTTFTFSLSNTIGSVNIYINDELVDTVPRSSLNLTYELPYTGEANIVKIEKPAAHNVNALFYIGNIKVPNCTFKNLSIEFDPVLKAGNKPLNDIAKKMIEYVNLYEDRETMYEILRKGNLGVGEIYKRLLEYWDLHHQNKHKGKRLTIKET